MGQIGGSAWAVDVDGTVAYAAIGENLLAIDVTDLEAPRTLGSILLHAAAPVTPTRASAVMVAGSYVYVTSGRDLQVVSVADHRHPEVVGVLSIATKDLAVAAGHGFAVDGGAFA